MEPPTRINALRKSAYPSITHCISVTVPPRLDWSAGSATFTTVLSTNAMLEPRIATIRIQTFAEAAEGAGRSS